MLDVVIVGGGPTGSRTAYQLARRGYRVAVLEKREGPGHKPCCTGIISRECVEAFGVPCRVISRWISSASIFSPSGENLRLSRPAPLACVLDRPAFDRYLAETAGKEGAEYYTNSGVENVEFRPDRVVVEVAGPPVRRLEARAAVLATGFGSAILRRANFGYPDYFVAGAQAEVELKGAGEVEIYFSQKLAPGFFSWIVPVSEGKGLVGLLTRRSPGLRLRQWLDSLRAEGKVGGGGYKVAYGGIPLKPLRRTSGYRCLLVGDAAGQVKPTTGGGIYFGLLSADIAAGCLQEALESGDLSAKKLSTYEHLWKKKLGTELRLEYLARRLYEHLSDKWIDSLIVRIKSRGIADSILEREDISFDWHGSLLLKAFKMGIRGAYFKDRSKE